ISPRLAMRIFPNTRARSLLQHARSNRIARTIRAPPALTARGRRIYSPARLGEGLVKARARSRRMRASATVVDLSSVRAQKRRELAERRVRAAVDENRAALARLFSSGLIFTQKGARAGRDLLLAHQALLKVVDLFARL